MDRVLVRFCGIVVSVWLAAAAMRKIAQPMARPPRTKVLTAA